MGQIALNYAPQLRRFLFKQSYLISLLLLALVLLIIFILQPNFFRPTSINSRLFSYLPLILLAVGQAIVIIGGGVDLSAGAIVSLVNVVIVQTMGGGQADASQMALAIGLGLLCGVLAGTFNGICIALLRFQPIITTFATSFVFSGLALWVLPRPGGDIPSVLEDLYFLMPLGITLAFWVMVVVLLAWGVLRSTRYGRYLFAVGGDAMAAYATGVPVSAVKVSTYVLSGVMAALAGLTLVIGSGSGDPLTGGSMTLSSIVAVVLGGTRLRGGQGGIAGAMIGVLILNMIFSIISFANVPTWWQVFVNGLIIMLALAGPGVVALIRRRVA